VETQLWTRVEQILGQRSRSLGTKIVFRDLRETNTKVNH